MDGRDAHPSGSAPDVLDQPDFAARFGHDAATDEPRVNHTGDKAGAKAAVTSPPCGRHGRGGASPDSGKKNSAYRLHA